MSKALQAKNKGGRPRIIFDEKLIEDLASIGCTRTEISTLAGCAPATLSKRFNEVLQAGYERGNTSLRRKMFQVAMGGNVMMLIWLSKQRLGMRDRQPDEAPQTVINVVCNEVP